MFWNEHEFENDQLDRQMDYSDYYREGGFMEPAVEFDLELDDHEPIEPREPCSGCGCTGGVVVGLVALDSCRIWAADQSLCGCHSPF